MTCPKCQVEFEPKYRGQLYCMPLCRRRAADARFYDSHREARGHEKRIRRKRHQQVLRYYVYQDKITKGCSVPGCGERRPNALDYHHIDPLLKTKNVGRMAKEGNVSLDTLKEEMAKCIILCACCHRVEEYGDGYRIEDRPGVVNA